MYRKYMLMLAALFAVAFVGSMGPAAFAGSGGFHGYLSDVMCAENGVSAGGFNLVTNPEKHTVACMKMPPCEASGYGVFVKDENTGRHVFHKFDANGTELAKQLLRDTARSDNMSIKVSGTMSDGMIIVENITEA